MENFFNSDLLNIIGTLPITAPMKKYSVGIVLTTKILEKAMTEFPQPTYLMILGFVLGSLAEVFPGIPAGMETISCLIALAAGTGIILFISRKF